ncbi:Lrp/AsnC family transcriptional regulator [Parasphingorhabdus sp.]|uniref:Lrp/AsnC family transcriptional regulator n=1 Tax=Parasphingorhabdus sp. TaxID=2709688 RepID=UPI003264CF0E
MDRLDWKIASALEENGRMSFADLGEQVGLSKSPCWTRVRELERRNVLLGYGAHVNPGAIGLGVQCYIAIRIGFDTHAKFEAAVAEHPAIFECHTTAGDSDYMLRVYARSVEHLDDLLRHEISKLPGVQSSSSTICLKSIKQRASLARWGSQLAGDESE